MQSLRPVAAITSFAVNFYKRETSSNICVKQELTFSSLAGMLKGGKIWFQNMKFFHLKKKHN